MLSRVEFARLTSVVGIGALGLLMCAAGVRSAGGQEAKTVPFDAPGAGILAGQGTYVAGANSSGVITGNYDDANGISHSYLRDASGKITTFDPPGTAQSVGGSFQGSNALGLNGNGAVAGYFVDANLVVHAYIRTPGGKFLTYDWPGACTTGQPTGCHGSGAWNINDLGVVVGPYEDTSGNFVAHTGIRFPDGRITTFEVPGSAMLAGEGTLPASFSGLNVWGAITGNFYDANYGFHGFIRDPLGNFHDFEAPGADTTDSFFGTFPSTINDFGTVAGYSLNTGGVYRGFVRDVDGTFKTFDAPGADTVVGDFNGTFPESENNAGAITGYYLDANEVYHGFVRTSEGKYVTFDAPGADLTPGGYSGTFPVSINSEGLVTGYFIDSNGVAHGFLRLDE